MTEGTFDSSGRDSDLVMTANASSGSEFRDDLMPVFLGNYCLLDGEFEDQIQRARQEMSDKSPLIYPPLTPRRSKCPSVTLKFFCAYAGHLTMAFRANSENAVPRRASVTFPGNNQLFGVSSKTDFSEHFR